MGAVEVLDRLAGLGITPKASGNKLLLIPGSKVSVDLFDQVKKYKTDIIEHLGPETVLQTVNMGLPKAQVEAAEAINEKFGITDPVHRRYNVLAWVRGYFEDRGENHGYRYEALKKAQQRLSGILEERGIG
jgi:hypothetical protein